MKEPNYILFHNDSIFIRETLDIDEGLLTHDSGADLSQLWYLFDDEERRVKLKYPFISFEEIVNKSFSQEHYDMLKKRKEAAFIARSDGKYVAWQRYAALGDEERAEEARREWLEAAAEVEIEFADIKSYKPTTADENSED